MAAIIPNLAAIMVGVGQNFPMSACEPTVQCFVVWFGVWWRMIRKNPELWEIF